MAAFLRTLHHRLREIGDATEAEMPYHLRQQDLADILGMTQVHVSRTLRGLYEAGILIFNGKTVTILNHAKLDRLAKS